MCQLAQGDSLASEVLSHEDLSSSLRAHAKSLGHGLGDDSAGKGPCQQPWQLEFYTQDLLGGRRELIPPSCPPTSTHVP